MQISPLTLDKLRNAVADNCSAIRRVRDLAPAGGVGDKVFPPTYEGAVYAVEERVVSAEDGTIRRIPTVLLDSVQSQANRMELALLRGYREGKLRFPLLQVDFAAGEADALISEIGIITSLEAPHRVADAIFRDAEYDGVDFRRSALGEHLNRARTDNATPLLEICPTALVFGMWDSTGPRGGLGAKFQRVLVSEIVGWECKTGVRPSSRLDPLQIEKEGVTVYKRAGSEDWTVQVEEAERKEGKLVPYKKEGKPSELNHGNITPSLKNEEGRDNHGGVTLTGARQVVVLSLAGLRRLRFPLPGDSGASRPEVDLAARTLLAALGLAAVCWMDLEGYDLRSRCLLDGAPAPFEVIKGGESSPHSLDAEGAANLLEEAATAARAAGLPWPEEVRTLRPSRKLKDLIRRSREKTTVS